MYKKRQANFSMEYLAVRELKKYENGRYSTGEPCAVPIEEIIEKQYDISIEYHYLRKNLSNLGQMVFEGGHVPIYDMEKKCYTLIDVPAKTMMIDIRLLQDRRFANRLRFTYAHELAHFLIHKEHFAHSEQSPALLAGEEEEYIPPATVVFTDFAMISISVSAVMRIFSATEAKRFELILPCNIS